MEATEEEVATLSLFPESSMLFSPHITNSTYASKVWDDYPLEVESFHIPLLLPSLPCTTTGGKTMLNTPTMGPEAQGIVREGTLVTPRSTSQVALFTTWMTLMPPKQDWSEVWELPSMEGVMLPMDDLEKGMLGLVSGADTGCLHLTSLQFDFQFSLWLVIDCWTSLVMSLPYALDPDFVTLQIAVVPDLSIYSVP